VLCAHGTPTLDRFVEQRHIYQVRFSHGDRDLLGSQ
jgi:hypothetical protein